MTKIEFIIPTYNRTNHLICLLGSLMAQTSGNWTANVVVDYPAKEIIDEINRIKAFFDSPKIKFTFLDKRYNDWGHTPRNLGVQMATQEWVIMTGEDNYYTPVFVDHFLKKIEAKVNFVFCNMLHNWTENQYFPIQCKPEINHIDIGCFMVRTALAKQMKLNTHLVEADGVFAKEYIKRFGGQIKHVEKILYVHN